MTKKPPWNFTLKSILNLNYELKNYDFDILHFSMIRCILDCYNQEKSENIF